MAESASHCHSKLHYALLAGLIPAGLLYRLRNACLRLSVIQPEQVPEDIRDHLETWWAETSRDNPAAVEGTISVITKAMADD